MGLSISLWARGALEWTQASGNLTRINALAICTTFNVAKVKNPHMTESNDFEPILIDLTLNNPAISSIYERPLLSYAR